MIARLIDLLWPRLKTPPPDPQTQARLAAVRTQLARPAWPAGEDAVILAEAQRIADSEAERRRSADNKAAIYLAAIAAVLPLLASTETIVWDSSIGRAPAVLTVWPLIATVIYLGAAGFWAARVLRVSAMARVDVEDVAGLTTNAARTLAAEHLKGALWSRDTTNAKISFLKMTHEFVLRAAVAFALVLLAETLWTGVQAFAGPPRTTASDAQLTTPPTQTPPTAPPVPEPAPVVRPQTPSAAAESGGTGQTAAPVPPETATGSGPVETPPPPSAPCD